MKPQCLTLGSQAVTKSIFSDLSHKALVEFFKKACTWLFLVHQRWEKIGGITINKIRDIVEYLFKNTHTKKKPQKHTIGIGEHYAK